VALTRHWVTSGSKPGVGGIFFLLWPFSVSHYLSIVFSSKVYSVLRLGNPKAAAHVAVDLQCWSLQSSNTIQYNIQSEWDTQQ